MTELTPCWIALPFFMGFVIYLFPKLDRYLAVGVALATVGYALLLFGQPEPLTWQFLDNFGVSLQADNLSAYFILTNGLVTAAVCAYCWSQGKSAFFYTQMMMLHGSVNAIFICYDLISVYIALEVIGIAAFLLIAYPRTNRSIWVALRYLFVSNTAMLFYLVGAILVFQYQQSFDFSSLEQAPAEAIALLCLGLLAKGGIFISGLWLPLTHSESESPVSAMLSGVVVTTGVFPLLRMANIVPEIDLVVRVFGLATALFGVIYAILEKDTKRMLAFSTISQLGFIMAAPIAAGFYALAHGLAKSALFLSVGALPSRKFAELAQTTIHRTLWIAIALAGLSLSGIPLIGGFAAKTYTLKNLTSWQEIGMNIAAVGTACVFAKLIFLKPGNSPKQLSIGFWLGVGGLIGGLLLANGLYYDLYSLETVLKALGKLALGWIVYWVLIRRTALELPKAGERLENLIGTMTLAIVIIFWMVVA
ncbi:MAG: cation:proton antiporter [Jaaginema sp. PMC 1079.18]|nr:cation:proton antiporter [Jaaginema sp. PMC 1080.18]MEC4853984.1 cation:proton antiporter [Jaaginema sp. PMC 1079.18]MEC4867383.1 cation:proton antiporter [Jaaginema sp. PMC 1078.18]